MDVKLENDDLLVQIKSKGAELFSVFNKKTKLEYMWSGDPAFWGKTSPVLFPIVGALKSDSYFFDGNQYQLSRHGFARDNEFEVAHYQNDQASFILKSNSDSLLKYPFPFVLNITYSLQNDLLAVTYSIENTGEGEMYFSIGAHPAFKVPLVDGTGYADHYLQFDKSENAPRWPINANGLIKQHPTPFLENTNRIKLDKSLFKDDAIVLKHLSSEMVSIRSKAHSHGLDFHFGGFPFLGIWAAKDADFVCIEPWCGIADAENHNQQFTSKEGIEVVTKDAPWSRTWSVRFF